VHLFPRTVKPGGLFIATVDLFLDCHPFTNKTSNEWGSNASIRDLVDASDLKLVQGNRSELYGYPQFDIEALSCSADGSTDFMIVNARTLTQCLVLERPKVTSH